MHLTLPWSGRTPIGIDLAGQTIKMAQCAPSRAGPRLLACASAHRPGSSARTPALTPDDADLIAGLIERNGFEGVELVLGVPRDLLLSASLELPPRSSGAPLEQIARLELARAHRVDPASFEMAMWEVPAPARASDATHALAVALSPPRLEPFIDALEARGLEVHALSPRPHALQNAAHPLLIGGGLTAFIDANWDGLGISISLDATIVVDRFIENASWARVCIDGAARVGSTPEAAHAALCGPNKAAVSVGAFRALASEYLETVVPEAARSVSYAAHRYPAAPPVRALLTGDAWALPGLLEKLNDALGVPVSTLDAGRIFKGPSPASATPACMVAAGLCLHALSRARRAA